LNYPQLKSQTSGSGDGAEASFLFNIHDFCAREHLYSGTVQSALKLLQQHPRLLSLYIQVQTCYHVQNGRMSK